MKKQTNKQTNKKTKKSYSEIDNYTRGIENMYYLVLFDIFLRYQQN
jgi:hypothetical protein